MRSNVSGWLKTRYQSLLAIATMTAVLGSVSIYVSDRYTLGLDFQEFRCLPDVVYLIDKYRIPNAEQAREGSVIALRLPENQRPSYARPEQIWIKRVVGKDAGTIMHVSEKGISFEYDGREWTHGTGLESADRVGKTPEDFERSEILEEGKLFLLGDLIYSYDSRYFGAVDEKHIIGTIIFSM